MRDFTPVESASSSFALGITINGSLPPELEHALFQFATGGARYRTTCALASGKGDCFHPRIANDLFDGLILDQQGLKNSVFKSGITKNIFNGEGALRNVGRVFEQADIAGH
jgi:hypothetical protein